MKCFVAYYSDEAEGEGLAERGELVIPGICLGEGTCHQWVGMESHRPSPGATVAEPDKYARGVDPLFESLCLFYPGLPRDLLEKYVLDSLVLAARLPLGSLHSVEITPSKATTLDMKTQESHVVWDEVVPADYV